LISAILKAPGPTANPSLESKLPNLIYLPLAIVQARPPFGNRGLPAPL
jgi:hypothetical protein